MIDNWLGDVAETCQVTLDVLNKKAHEKGHLSNADQTMTNLCLGYLYLLNLCDRHEVFEASDMERFTEIIEKNTTIH